MLVLQSFVKCNYILRRENYTFLLQGKSKTIILVLNQRITIIQRYILRYKSTNHPQQQEINKHKQYWADLEDERDEMIYDLGSREELEEMMENKRRYATILEHAMEIFKS